MAKRWATYMQAGWRRLKPRLVRQGIFLLLFVFGVALVPHVWCARQAGPWYFGLRGRWEALARGVEAAVQVPLGRQAFRTGSRQFDGEWLFGSYMMAGMGFGQLALARPDLREWCLRNMAICIDRLQSPEVRAFDRETWGNDPLDTLDAAKVAPNGGGPPSRSTATAREPGHAAFLGYFNLVLSLNRRLDPASPYAALNDRITAALVRRLEASPLPLLQSYPGEMYPVDNCAVIASIALHGAATGTDHGALLRRWGEHCRAHLLDPQTGLLFQAVDPETGQPIDAARGSGTSLGVYFLGYADSALSRDLYTALRRELAGSVLGFGGVREYPRQVRGEFGDIDSGPVVFGYGLSATGFALAGTRLHGDPALHRRLFATAWLCGAPYEKDGRFQFVSGGPLGNAILFAMLTAPRVEEAVGREARAR